MSKRRIAYIHIFIWLFAIFANLPYSNFRNGMASHTVTSVIAFLYLMMVFYIFYLFLVPRFLSRKKLISFFTLSFLVVLIMPFFGYMILFLSRALVEGTFKYFLRGYSLGTHMSGFYPVVTAAVFGSFFRIMINWYTVMNQNTELDKQKLAVELQLIRSKLNPHFLFNSLNNIDSLIHNDPEAASSALIKLSGIMRYLTYETTSEVVALGSEVEYMRNLIELHRMRIKSPEDIRFEVGGDMNVLISPALFVPLIENSFKFVSIKKMKPFVDISLSSESGVIIFEISNCYDPDSAAGKNDHSGYGLINLKKRLELTYPGKHQLKIEKGDQKFHVKLIIDTNAN